MTPCSPPSRRGLAAAGVWRDGATAILDGGCARRREGGKSGRRTVLGSNREPGLRGRRTGAAYGLLTLPGRAARHDGVDEDEQLSGAGNQRELVLLAGRPQSFVQRDELRVPAHGGRQRGQVERAAQAFAPAVDV